MQPESFLSPASLALSLACQKKKKKKKRQALIFISILSDCQAVFRVARAATALLERITYLLQVLLYHWVVQIVNRVLCLLLHDWRTEEDGVMGGHIRRSKQSVKASFTVLCDSAAALDDWKQHIKVKDSIPASQQRLTFASQRAVKQHFALAKLSPSRQWQIVVDSSVEEVYKDLRSWHATLRSKNTSAELLQPVVLKETDELATFLHSRTADELREIGVPCCVFFVSFNECIPTLEKKELSLSNQKSRGLDLKIDKEFREDIFFIDLYGDLSGVPIPVPLRYVMNGSQVATKLFMVEQTAQYREEQKQRHQHQSAPISAEKSEGLIELNSHSSHSNDYVVEIEQDCEFTAFISRDHHRLKCIVLPVVTIPLVETKGNEELPFLYLPIEDFNETLRESTSNVLTLPSTSEIKEALSEVSEASNTVARNILEEVQPSATRDISTRKTAKKKRRKKAKKAAKENVKDSSHLGQDAMVEAKGSSCSGALMKHAEEEPKVDSSNCLNAEISTEKDTEDEGQLSGGNKLKHGSTTLIRNFKCYPLAEVENKVNSTQHSKVSSHLDQKETRHTSLAASHGGSDSVSLCRNEHIKQKERADQDGHVNNYKEAELSVSTGKGDEIIQLDDTSMHKEISADVLNTGLNDHSVVHGYFGQRVIHSVQPASSAFESDSGSCSISKLAGMKKFKEPFNSKLQGEAQSTLHRQIVGDYLTNSHGNERGNYAGSPTKFMQQSFWAHRAGDSQDFLPNRTRTNQNSTGAAPVDSRSSVPFWRHQREDIPISSFSWSKPRPARADDWNSSRRHSSPFWQSRNMSAWEQLPNLRRPSNGDTFPLHWENPAPLDRPWSLSSRGQSYSSFNMQQRKFGKSNKICSKYSNKWQPQGMPNDRIAPNMECSTTCRNISSVRNNSKTEAMSYKQTFSKDIDGDASHKFVQGPILGINFEGKTETCDTVAGEGGESCITVQTTANAVDSLQLDSCLSVPNKSGLQLPNSQVAEHVCEILEAVNASFESWDVYEQVSQLNGNSLCEFERVAKAVAPAFQASTTQQKREHIRCLCKSLVAKSKNGRHIPDVRLSTLWHWYEEPSSYGLKVKLSESSKRTGNNLQAFFVPYLSAIQLFGWSRKERTSGLDAAAQGGSPLDSQFLSQPIFSILLPRPEIDDDSHTIKELPEQAQTNLKVADDGAISSSGRQCHCDVELLYEFFEVEKPQQRKPLTDRIKELVSNLNVSSGDAHLLTSAKINDLHPSSWFAVAWYPIYKIPDETFRSAFLTYHSLSCLQSTSSGTANTKHSMDNCMNTITAPVVGLMSYNAQVKDWFFLSPSCNMNHNILLQQYLANLEAAATTMARGSCAKLSSFKHADFTFFQSRRR